VNGRLSPELRVAALAGMVATELDVLVVGGGVVGAGVALDAVTRGLSVGLVEMRDWASGASSRSSMLLNGGVSAFETHELGSVRESLHERALLFDRIAPHLVHRMPFLYPLRHHGWERAYVGAGLTLLDALGHPVTRRRGLPSHRHLSARTVRRLAPSLRPEPVTGAVQYYEAQVDDARYVITTVRTAASYGALVASRIRATEFITDGDRVAGISADDLDTGDSYGIRAKVVVGATGVWSEQLIQMARSGGVEPQSRLRVEAGRGVHLVVPRDRIRSSSGLICRTSTTTVMMIPWGRHWIVGTTETELTDDLGQPSVTEDDIEHLLEQVNQCLVAPLTRQDVEATYAGLRPLLADEEADRPRLSPRHQVVSPAEGLVLVTGGRFTTYRVMAAEAVDAAAKSIGGLVAESITDRVALLGADGYQVRWNQRHLLARRAGLHVARVEHLLNRYGAMADQLLDLIADQPELARPMPGAEDYLAVEVVYAVTHEGATHLSVILTRRTRIAFETRDRGMSAAPYAVDLVSPLLGWDARRSSRQLSGYLGRAPAPFVP
jgi:glycerol-3-phosphate dehydrogenase